MTDMSRTNIQHYVPQFYMRKFGSYIDESDKFVDICHTNTYSVVEKVSVNSICKSNHLYDIDNDQAYERFHKSVQDMRGHIHYETSGTLNRKQPVEKLIADIEARAAQVIGDLLDSNDPNLLDDLINRHALLMFISNLHVRNPIRRKQLQDYSTHEGLTYGDVQSLTIVDKAIDLQLYFVALMQSEWHLVNVPDGYELVTSNNPVYDMNLDDYCLPISKDRAILIQQHRAQGPYAYSFRVSRKTGERTLTPYAVNTNNRRHYAHSDFLIGSKDTFKQLKQHTHMLIIEGEIDNRN